MDQSTLIALNALSNLGANVVDGLNQKRQFNDQKQKEQAGREAFSKFFTDNPMMDDAAVSHFYGAFAGSPGMERYEPIVRELNLKHNAGVQKQQADLAKQEEKRQYASQREDDRAAQRADTLFKEDVYSPGRTWNSDLTPDEKNATLQSVQGGNYKGTVARKYLKQKPMPEGIDGPPNPADTETAEQQVPVGMNVPKKPQYTPGGTYDSQGNYHTNRINPDTGEIEPITVQGGGGFFKATTQPKPHVGGKGGSKPMTESQRAALAAKAATDQGVLNTGVTYDAIKNPRGVTPLQYNQAKERQAARSTAPQGGIDWGKAAAAIKKAQSGGQ